MCGYRSCLRVDIEMEYMCGNSSVIWVDIALSSERWADLAVVYVCGNSNDRWVGGYDIGIWVDLV